jgi:hypothetical protein
MKILLASSVSFWDSIRSTAKHRTSTWQNPFLNCDFQHGYLMRGIQ